jgi:hypothetical protein
MEAIMFTIDLKCPKCNREMIEGFIADNKDGAILVSKWIEGEPQKGFWGSIKTKGKRSAQIKTYMCSGCGYLESYAS